MASPTGLQSQNHTPIRAIPSKLSLKSSASVPPAGATFEPLIKTLLQRRLVYKIFPYSYGILWVSTIVWRIWSDGVGIRGALSVPFIPSTHLVAVIQWATIALPLVILRKTYISYEQPSGSSPYLVVTNAISKTAFRVIGLTLMVISITSAALHKPLSTLVEDEDPHLNVFVKSRKHPLYLNGRFLYLIAAYAATACCFVLRMVLQNRLSFRWISSRQSLWKLTALDLLGAIVVALLLSFLTLPLAWLSFAGARILLYGLFRVPLISLALRPFAAHFLRGPSTLSLPFRHFPLLFRGWAASFNILLAWEWSAVVFDSFLAQPTDVASTTPDPFLILVSGTSSSNRVYKYLAYSELIHWSSEKSAAARAKRTAFFGDQKYNPNLWSQLLRESLLLLGQDYQHFLRRGKAEAPSAKPPVPPPPTPAVTVPSTPLSVLRKPVFRPPKTSPLRSVVDSLASDGSFSQAVSAGAEAAHLPQLFKSVENTLIATPVSKEAQQVATNASGALANAKVRATAFAGSLVQNHAPKVLVEAAVGWKEWWTSERLSKVTDGYLPSRALDVLVIEVISHLTCASLEEDQYGVVQRDIPKILEAFLSFLSAIEAYQIELGAKCVPPSSDKPLSPEEAAKLEALRDEIDKAGDILCVVGNALKEGVTRIVRTFGDKLLAFRFPPRTATKLQGYLDYTAVSS